MKKHTRVSATVAAAAAALTLAACGGGTATTPTTAAPTTAGTSTSSAGPDRQASGGIEPCGHHCRSATVIIKSNLDYPVILDVFGVDNHDWQSNRRPDHRAPDGFKMVVIFPLGQLTRVFDVNIAASHSPFGLDIRENTKRDLIGHVEFDTTLSGGNVFCGWTFRDLAGDDRCGTTETRVTHKNLKVSITAGTRDDYDNTPTTIVLG